MRKLQEGGLTKIQSKAGHFANLTPEELGILDNRLMPGRQKSSDLMRKHLGREKNALQQAHFCLKGYETVTLNYIRISYLVVTIYTNINGMKSA
ncbi:MAG: hypothetical protein JW730_17570 [Anaerolineales bacterium]|nr:hypothetical protein [Anaerolineales bacterium]